MFTFFQRAWHLESSLWHALGSIYCCLDGTSSLWSYLKVGFVLLLNAVAKVLLMKYFAYMHTHSSKHVPAYFFCLFAATLTWFVVSFWDMEFQNLSQLDANCTYPAQPWWER